MEKLCTKSQTKMIYYWLQKSIETKNSFNSLTDGEKNESNEDKINKTKSVPKALPIYKLLTKITEWKYSIKSIRFDAVNGQL